MAKDKKTVTNAMRLLNASKIKYETVEYEADEVGEHFGEAIAEMTGIPAEKSFKTLVARGDKTGIMVSCIAVNHEVDFCKVYDMETKEKVERILLKNRISYFVEWEEKGLNSLLFFRKPRGKSACIFRIHSDEVPKAKQLLAPVLGSKIKGTGGND